MWSNPSAFAKATADTRPSRPCPPKPRRRRVVEKRRVELRTAAVQRVPVVRHLPQKLVLKDGIEPPTHAPSTRRSTAELLERNGAAGGYRSRRLLVGTQGLYL